MKIVNRINTAESIKSNRKLLVSINALIACIILIITIQLFNEISLLMSMLCFFSLAELFYSIKLKNVIKDSKKPQEVIIEFNIRIFVPFLFALISVLYSIFGVLEIVSIGMLLYASVAEVRLNNEIVLYKECLYYRGRILIRSNNYKKAWKFRNYILLKYESKGRKKKLIVNHEYLKYLNIGL